MGKINNKNIIQFNKYLFKKHLFGVRESYVLILLLISYLTQFKLSISPRLNSLTEKWGQSLGLSENLE